MKRPTYRRTGRAGCCCAAKSDGHRLCNDADHRHRTWGGRQHGPLFSGIDLALTSGFHAIQMPGGPGQTALLLTLAGRLKATHGTVTVLGDAQPRAIRWHCSVAAFDEIDELEESVTVQTVLAEQRRWLAPWYARVPIKAGEAELGEVFGDTPAVGRVVHRRAVRPGTVPAAHHAGAVFQPSDPGGWRPRAGPSTITRRAIAVDRLGAIATQRTVVVGVTNPLGADAPDHELHDRRILTGRG